MDDKELLDIYTDYLISSFGLTTGTGLSRLLDGAISHDRIQRFLASPTKGGADFSKIVKPYLRQIQADDGVMIVDDSISEKPHTDENEIVCWHYDHSSGQTIKGINFITALRSLLICALSSCAPFPSSSAKSSVALLTSMPIQCSMSCYFWVAQTIAGEAERQVRCSMTLIGPHAWNSIRA